MLYCFIFINQESWTFTYLLYFTLLYFILLYLLACFLPPLRTYLSLIRYVMGYCWKLTISFSKTTLRKMLTFCQGTFLIMIFVKSWQRWVKTASHYLVGVTMELLNSIMKTYVLFIFHNQINVNCKNGNIAAILTLSYFHATGA